MSVSVAFLLSHTGCVKVRGESGGIIENLFNERSYCVCGLGEVSLFFYLVSLIMVYMVSSYMKLLTYFFTSLGLMSGCLAGQVKSDLKAIPVMVSYFSALPDGVDYLGRPINYKKGLRVTFFLRGENIISVDEKSLKAKGWTMKNGIYRGYTGKSVSLTLHNESFKGNLNDFKISAVVEVMFGVSSKTRKIFFKKGDKPVKFLGFTAEVTQHGVKVVGEHNVVKSISISRNGSDEFSSVYTGSGNSKTFILEGIKDTDEISVTYWSDIEARSVKLVR